MQRGHGTSRRQGRAAWGLRFGARLGATIRTVRRSPVVLRDSLFRPSFLSSTFSPTMSGPTPADSVPAVGESVWLRVVDGHTCYYQNEELVA